MGRVLRIVPLGNLGDPTGILSVAVPEQPRAYRLKTVYCKLALTAVDADNDHATVTVTFALVVDVTLTVTSDSASDVFVFANADPGGGVVWIDNTAFTTGDDMANGFETALVANGFPDSEATGAACAVRASNSGPTSTMEIAGAGGSVTASNPNPNTGFDLPAVATVLVRFKSAGIATYAFATSGEIAFPDTGNSVVYLSFADEASDLAALDASQSTPTQFVSVRMPTGIIVNSTTRITVELLKNLTWECTLSELVAGLEDVVEDYYG